MMPDLPTMAEAGVPGVVAMTDYAMYAPAGTPKEVIDRLNREMQAVLQMPDLQAKLATQGIETGGSTPEALRAEVNSEVAKWERVIRAANLKLE
jgi:tripartite-type tricarboxylate transporter receptor subunit TctC